MFCYFRGVCGIRTTDAKTRSLIAVSSFHFGRFLYLVGKRSRGHWKSGSAQASQELDVGSNPSGLDFAFDI